MKYVIGIDGGGTKTEAVLADRDGNILMNKIYGSTNPNAVSIKELEDTFRLLFQDMEKRFPGCLDETISLFAGISGAGSVASRTLLEEIFSGYFSPDTKINVVVDSINALYSGTFGTPGIVQICGTGSITYGINEHGEQDRVGGWGFLLGDEGSGYDVGKKGISAALKYYDGRGPETILLRSLLDYYEVDNGRTLIDKIYHSSSPRLEIAKVSKLVFEAYELGDSVAITIMKDVAEEVCHSIRTLHKKLKKTNGKTEVVLCGGLFSNERILPVLLKEVLDDGPFNLILPKVPPVAGSVVGGFIEVERTITPSLKDNLKKFWE